MKKGSTDIYTLRTIWMNQIKATPTTTGNLSRAHKHISGRAGRVAWKLLQLELIALLRHRKVLVSGGEDNQ